jgi:hypothetical protein
MLAGVPGSQKSGFALWLAVRWGLSTLYFSADQDQHTTVTRLAGVITGHSKDTVTAGLDGSAEGYYLEALEDVPITFCYDTAPGLDDVEQELAAYVELYDEWPEVIVVDNLINIQIDHDNEWSALRLVLTELQAMARLTGAAVVVLHHMAEGSVDPTMPAPRKALHGKVSQRPEVILSLAFNGNENGLLVAKVKDRHGPADPTGKTFVRLAVEPEKTRFLPWTGGIKAWGYSGDED